MQYGRHNSDCAVSKHIIIPGPLVDSKPNDQGLARLAGLRAPSETHISAWGDVDWAKARLSVHAPKTARFDKHPRRTVPIVPRLMRILEDAFDPAEAGQEWVVGLSRNNLYRTMHAVSGWLGHSEAVSREHYL